MKLKSGFTLLELLIAMGLMIVFLLVLTEIIVTLVNGQLETFSTSTVSQEAKFLLARISYDLRRADAVTQPVNLGDVGNTLQLTISGQPVGLGLVNGNIEYTDASGMTVLNRTNTRLTQLTFQKIGNPTGAPTVQIKLTVESKIEEHGTFESNYLQTTVGLK